MIIDPPSAFSPLKDWTLFRKDMEAELSSDPGNADLLENLKLAKEMEARLKTK